MAVLKYFLLHEDPLVRDSVGFHLYEGWSRDRELVPLVIEASERYGEHACLRLLGFACRFEMTHRSVEASFRVLERTHPPFVEQWVARAPIELLTARNGLLERTLSEHARSRLSRRARLHEISTRELWSRLDARASELDRDRGRPGDGPDYGPDYGEDVEDLVEALSRKERPHEVLARLAPQGEVGSVHRAMFAVEVAGARQISESTPRLVDLLGHDANALAAAAASSLARLGNPGMLRLLRERYGSGSHRFRWHALAVMKAVKLGVAERALRSLVEVESDPGLRARIFDGLRFHFTVSSAEALRHELKRRTSAAPEEELRKALYVLSQLFGVPDADAERWRRATGDDPILFEFRPDLSEDRSP